MDSSYVEKQLIEILCKDYQTIWLIKPDDLSLTVYASDMGNTIPDSVEIVSIMNSYETARLWYIENCVIDSYKARLLEKTSMEHIILRLKDGRSYYVEYGRLNGDEINFNQFCYDKILNPASGETEYVVMGFRSIDITQAAETDNLTGALTRNAFFQKAEAMLWNNKDTSYDLIMSDILDFKKINEVYGVKAADKLLSWLGRQLLAIISSDILLCRYGGDQFVMFGESEAIKNSFKRFGKKEFHQAEKESGLPEIKIKFGVYRNVNHDDTILASCDKAHMALNSIKSFYNKPAAYYDETLENAIEKKRRIENSMYQSMNNGDFKVYYQPKHDAKTGKLAGAEALIRWIHPEYGFMSPGDFIPLFEQNGFIVKNDHFVWEQTCRNCKKWEAKGILKVPISVNVSKMTMSDQEFLKNLKGALEEYKVRPELLHVEVTESLMDENVTDTVGKLNDIRALGIRVELDDFGSGYSSFDALCVLPLDVVKLDMSFMKQFGDKKRAKVLENCINLSRELGFKTVSEGVELDEQRDVLNNYGVDIIQGYLYSKPLPEEDFEAYLMQYSDNIC